MRRSLLSPRSAVSISAQPVASGPQRVAAILNPIKSGAIEAKARIIEACKEAGWPHPVFFETTPEDPGGGQARQAVAEGADIVLAGGGDGTVRPVAEVLVDLDTPLGILPLGTGNLLARNLSMPINRTDLAVRVALFGHERYIDVVTASLSSFPDTAPHAQSFLVMAGIGFDARVIASTRSTLKKNLRELGWLAYGEAGLRHLRSEQTRVAIELDDGPAEIHYVASVLVGNCGLIPAGIEFIPDALLDDGLLDVVIVAPANPVGWIPVAGKILLKHRRELSQLQYRTARKVVIRTDVSIESQIDGDPTGLVRVFAAEVRPQALRIRVPAS